MYYLNVAGRGVSCGNILTKGQVFNKKTEITEEQEKCDRHYSRTGRQQAMEAPSEGPRCRLGVRRLQGSHLCKFRGGLWWGWGGR